MYTLFYYPRNASFAPHIVLKSLGVPHQLELVDRRNNQQKAADYLKLNPSGRIPTLVQGDFVLCESAAICLYLAESHPEHNLIPSSVKDKALFYQWLMYLTTSLQQELMVYFYPERHTQNAIMYSDIIQAQQVRLKDIFILLDKHLFEREFMVGDHFTICDCYMFMLCVWADELKSPPLSFKNINIYLKKLATHPAIQSVCEIEDTDLSSYKL